MKNNKKTPDVGASEVQRKNAVMSKINSFLYYITVFSGLTSIIACANITGLWSGIVAMASVGVTLAMMVHTTGGFINEED